MKNLILLILLVSCTLTGYGQGGGVEGLGWSRAELQQRWPDSEYLIREFLEDQGDKVYKVFLEDMELAYFFQGHNICTAVAIRPKTISLLKEIISGYNSLYVTVSAGQWKNYTKSGMAHILLVYADSGDAVFIWSYELI